MRLFPDKHPKGTKVLVESSFGYPIEIRIMEWTESGRFVKVNYLNGSFGWFDVKNEHKVLEVLVNGSEPNGSE